MTPIVIAYLLVFVCAAAADWMRKDIMPRCNPPQPELSNTLTALSCALDAYLLIVGVWFVFISLSGKAG